MSQFNDRSDIIQISCSTADMSGLNTYTASGAVLPFNPRDLMVPEPIYETRIAKKETPVQQQPDDTVTTMKLLDYDPNKPLIDADQASEEQRIMTHLTLEANARLALFMKGCRDFRENELTTTSVTELTNMLIDLHFSGRAPLDSTSQHLMTMKLVLRAALERLVSRDQPSEPESDVTVI